LDFKPRRCVGIINKGEKIMADSIKKNYKISGSGILCIDDGIITICVEDKAEFDLASLLSDLDGCAVKFSFSHDEDCAETVEVEEETGEVI
jgi:hypothetical protein